MPKRINFKKVSAKSQDKAKIIALAAEILAKGGVILYPTDTLYALGADALNKQALEKIYKIKGRLKDKAISVLVSDIEMLKRYTILSPKAKKLITAFLPGPLTLVLPSKPNQSNLIPKNQKTLGIRIPQNDFCLLLSRQYNKPITATSANKSGSDTLATPTKILKQLGDKASLIDLIIDNGILPKAQPSTVIAITKQIKLIRAGAIPWKKIERIIK